MKNIFTKEFGIGSKILNKIREKLGLNKRLLNIKTLKSFQHKKFKTFFQTLITGKNLKNLINNSLILKQKTRLYS